MATINYFLVCENFIVDENDRLTSIINTFDEIWSDKFPMTPRKFTLAMDLELTEEEENNGEFTTGLLIEDPSKKRIFEAKGRPKVINPDADNRRIISSVDVGGKINFKKAGSYNAKLLVNDSVVSQRKIDVKEAK